MTKLQCPMTGDRPSPNDQCPQRTDMTPFLGHWSLGIHWSLRHWSLVISSGSLGIHWSLDIGHWSFPRGHWKFTGHWSLVIGHFLGVIGNSLVIGHWSLVISSGHCEFTGHCVIGHWSFPRCHSEFTRHCVIGHWSFPRGHWSFFSFSFSESTAPPFLTLFPSSSSRFIPSYPPAPTSCSSPNPS